ncbi:MAG: DNA-processing protein DprA, partial [Patescibacteria group bacterium]
KIFQKSLAIVGSRRITGYGRQVIDKIVPDLVSQGITIISGFMYGVDSEAHKKCLEFGGKTIAVLGGGLGEIYPPENEKLIPEIIKNGGLVVSEYEADFKPRLWSFPQRNRIISGLSSLGVLIVEAGEKSGSLITAKLGLKQKKPLFAVPGPTTSSVSIGTNTLIKEGKAKMVLSANDIYEEIITDRKRINSVSADTTELKIIQALSAESLTVDEIIRNLNLDIVKASSILIGMTLKGLISESGGKYYLTRLSN